MFSTCRQNFWAKSWQIEVVKEIPQIELWDFMQHSGNYVLSRTSALFAMPRNLR